MKESTAINLHKALVPPLVIGLIVMQVDFTKTVTDVNVPVYFFAGRYDYNTPSVLTAAYFNALHAPRGKELIWFEDSAHPLIFDEPERLTQEIIRVKDVQRGESEMIR